MNEHGPTVPLPPATFHAMFALGMEDFGSLHDRIAQLCEVAADAGGDPGVMHEMNALLSEGYACALMAESRLIRLEEQLADHIAGVGVERADEIPRLARRHRSDAQAVADLRADLATLHRLFLGLGGVGSPP